MDQFVIQGAKAVDLDGVEIGTVDRVYRERESDTLLSEPIGGETRFGRGYLQVGARVTGLGRTLYIPFGEITDADEAGVHINVHKDAVENRDWDLRPPVLDAPQWQGA
jgi:hypothetical protein